MIAVDSSAVIAILFGEASAPALLRRLAEDGDRVISVASYVETGTVLAGRRRSDRHLAVDDLDRFLDEAGIAPPWLPLTRYRRASPWPPASAMAAGWAMAAC